MVEVCKRLIEKKPDIKIAIVGYGDDDAYVSEALSAHPENVLLAGKVPFNEMVSYYNKSRIYASTSYYEGLPGTCLEAMAMQLPAVVWDFMFYRGLVKEGQTGFVIPPNEFQAMASKIVDLLGDKQALINMGVNGRKLLETEYSWSKLAVDVLRVFE